MRARRIFAADGKSLVVALDHAAGRDVFPELADPRRLIEEVVEAGADAVLATSGLIERFGASFGRAGVILRADGGTAAESRGGPRWTLRQGVEDALRLGADAVACMGFPSSPLEIETLDNIAKLAGECRKWGVPLMAEMIPGGFGPGELDTVEAVRHAARVGVELGADLIKTKFAGTPETFRTVTGHVYRPVLVLGGSRTDDERALLEMIAAAMQAGAKGAVIGRNIWGAKSPGDIARTLAGIIHGERQPSPQP